MINRILFRYHKDFDICLQNLKNLKKLNPDLAIDGLFGGDERSVDDIPADLISLLDTNWVIPFDDPYYKWKNGDLCVREWYKQHGHTLPFSHITLIEWDLYTFKPLSTIYPDLVAGHNYASIFGDYAYARSIDWHWVIYTYSYEFEQLQALLEKDSIEINKNELSFGIMGGAVFCREFLDAFIRKPVPSYSNDELRFSVYSQAFGIPLKDNGLYRNPKNLFDADGKVFDLDDYHRIKENDGDIIHPLRMLVNNHVQTN